MRGRKCADLTGQRFGRWTVIRRAGSHACNSDGLATTFPLWLCRCDCGNEGIVIGENLKSGKSRSCGCLRSELASERGKKRAKVSQPKIPRP